MFSGVFESPNRQFKLEVTDTGIALRGPTGRVTLTNGGIDVQSIGPSGVVVEDFAAKVEVKGGIVKVTGAQVQLNGCLPIARVGDLVLANPAGQILTGSPTVCAG